jgi:predicted HAD superfamily hydrolase
MQDAETTAELCSLRANRDLVNWLVAMRAEGKQVIVISDTYLFAAVVNTLVFEKSAEAPMERFYASSDLGLTMRSGKIFASVAAMEGAPLARMVW